MIAIAYRPDRAASGELQLQVPVTRVDDLSRDEQRPERTER
jgi:hypothetical protein